MAAGQGCEALAACGSSKPPRSRPGMQAAKPMSLCAAELGRSAAVELLRPRRRGLPLSAVWGANREEEGGAAAERGFTPEATMMALLDDALARGKTQARLSKSARKFQ